MRLDDFKPSDNVEDRRGDSSSGGGGGIQIGGGRIGIVGIVIILVVSYVTGINPLTLFGAYENVTGGGGTTQTSAPPRQQGPTGAPTDASGQFVARVLESTEETWNDIFQRNGKRYVAPTLVLFSGQTASACGAARAAMGPFYCPNDRKVYLDTAFFDEMRRRFNACPATQGACAFSQGYVIAHEIGHHVQNLLGLLPKVHQAEEQAGSEADANALSVRVELQADCYAGIWGNHNRERMNLSQDDVAAALQTAQAIGDDTLQRATRGQAVPDSFTHGSSAQRQHWFVQGFQTGQPSACNTFAQQQ